MTQMGSKLNVFKDPFMDRASETEDLMAKIRALGGDAAENDNSPGQRIAGSAGSFGAKRTEDGTDYSSPLGKGSAGRLGAAGGIGSDYSSSSFGAGKRGARGKDHLGDLMSLSDDMKAKA